MHGAQKIVMIRESDNDGESRADFVAIHKPTIKRLRPLDDPTNREMRRRRDMVYLLLSQQGLSSDEIAKTCKFAARTAAQIRLRLRSARKYYASQGTAACG